MSIQSLKSKKQPRLLVADDDPDFAEIIEAAAENIGFQVYCTYEGSEVVDRTMTLSPDVLVLDLRMPGMDGVEVLRELGNIGSAVKILLISGMDQRTLNSVAQLGVDQNLNIVGALVKPMRPDALLDVLSPLYAAAASGGDIVTTLSDQPISDYGFRIRFEIEKPQYPSKDNSLLRVILNSQWDLNDGKVLAGADFMAWADKNGVSKGMTELLLRETLRGWQVWRDVSGEMELKITLTSSLLEDVKITDLLSNIADHYSFKKSNIIIETEGSGVFQSQSNAIDVLSRLRIKGFKVAIIVSQDNDDLMARIDKLPIDELVADMTPLASNNGIHRDMELEFKYSSLTSLARRKGIKTCAINIEHEGVLEFAKRSNFDRARGGAVGGAYSLSELKAQIALA